MSHTRVVRLAVCALTVASLAAPGIAGAQQPRSRVALERSVVAAPQPAISMPIRIALTGAALVVGVMVGLIPAILLGMLLGLIPRPARAAPQPRAERAPPSAQRPPIAPPIVPPRPAQAIASAPVAFADLEPEPPADVEAAESRDRHRSLYDDAFSDQLRRLDSLRRTITIQLAVPSDGPPPEEPDR